MQGEHLRVEIKLAVSAPKAPPTDPAWATKATATPTPAAGPRRRSSSADEEFEEFFGTVFALFCGGLLAIAIVFILAHYAFPAATTTPTPTVQITNAPIICYTPGCETQAMIPVLDQNYGKGQGVFTAANLNAEQVWQLNLTNPGHLLVNYGASYVQSDSTSKATLAPTVISSAIPSLSSTTGGDALVGVGNAFTLQILDDHYRLLGRFSDPQSLYQFVITNLAWNGSPTYYLTIQLDPTRIHYLTDPNSNVELQYFIQLTP